MRIPRRSEATRCQDPEAGFTLLEMVIAVVIMVMITGAISAAFISSLNASSATKNRVGASQDAQLISGFLTRDAQAAGGTNPASGLQDPTLGVTLPTGAFTNGCLAPVGSTSLVGFKWIDQGSGTAYEANYSYVSTDAGTYKAQQVLRTVCSDTVPTPATSVLANNVVTTASGSLTVPSASCSPSCPADTASLPNTVTMALTIFATADNVTTPYPYTLTASLRPQGNAHPDLTDPLEAAPMLLLGDGGVCSSASIAAGGAAGVQILGQGTISSGCQTVSAHGCGNGCGDIASEGMFVYSPTNDPNACAQVDGTCTVVTHKFADPYAAAIQAGLLHAPSTAGCNNGSNPSPDGAGNFGGSTTFPQLFNLNQVTTFSPGGVYIFCKGITVRQNMTAGPDGGGSGSLFYVASGGVSISGGVLSVTPPNSGQYAGLALWQAAGDTNTLSGGTIDIEGTAYLPSARVTFKNGSDYIEQLVAAGIDLQSGNNTTQLGRTLTITSPATLPNATQGQLYSTTITATGGAAPPYAYTISGLPAGLSYNSSTGVISGTPTGHTSGNSIPINITVKGFFGAGHDVDTQAATLKVLSSPTLTAANPTGLARGLQSQTVTFTGTNLINNGSLALSFSGTGVTATSPNVTSGTTMTAVVSVADNAALGARNVMLTNGDGSTYTAPNLFTVLPPTITSLVLQSGGATAGRIDKGDTVVVTFSAQMSVSSFCPGWSGDTNPQSLTADNDVTVSISDGTGATDDKLTVTSAACPSFHFGNIDLGSNAYVSAAATFKGAAPNASSINWNPATPHTLTIKVGAMATGTVATVTKSIATYNASNSITDSLGTALNPATYATTNIKQF